MCTVPVERVTVHTKMLHLSSLLRHVVFVPLISLREKDSNTWQGYGQTQARSQFHGVLITGSSVQPDKYYLVSLCRFTVNMCDLWRGVQPICWSAHDWSAAESSSSACACSLISFHFPAVTESWLHTTLPNWSPVKSASWSLLVSLFSRKIKHLHVHFSTTVLLFLKHSYSTEHNKSFFSFALKIPCSFN